jgi:hypothetical protein
MFTDHDPVQGRTLYGAELIVDPALQGHGIGGLYLRRHLPQGPTVQEVEPPAISPVAEAFRTQWHGILRVAGLNVLTAIGFYLDI